MSRITRDEVERVAGLARLSLSDAEAGRVAEELGRVLDYVEQLGALDTAQIVPTSHAIPMATPMREDRAEPAMDPALVVRNAPEAEGSAFVVPKVIDSEAEG